MSNIFYKELKIIMKKYYIIWFVLIVSNLFSQNKKYTTISFENILLNNNQLFFELKNITSLEKYLGKLHEKSNV